MITIRFQEGKKSKHPKEPDHDMIMTQYRVICACHSVACHFYQQKVWKPCKEYKKQDRELQTLAILYFCYAEPCVK